MDLKSLRKSKGLTQEQAADATGLSRRGYQNLESGSYKKKDSKTLRYALAVLESFPDPRKKRALSITGLSRAVEELLDGESVKFAYYQKVGSSYRFVLDTDMDDLSLYGLEEELASTLNIDVSFERFSTLIASKEEASSFFFGARRIYPAQ